MEVNDINLYYEVAGEGKPIIPVHPNSADHSVFAAMIEKLVDAGYRVYAPDTREQGKSSDPDEYHYIDMMEDMYCFIENLGLEKTAYYGWSNGGIIGLLLEINHPGTLSVMAVSGANLNPNGVNMDDETVRWIEEEIFKTHDPLLSLMFAEPDIAPEQLKQIDIPVLVVAGSEDLILPEHTQLIADSLPNSTLMIMDGYDHSDYIVNTDANPNYDETIMVETLIEFLQKNGY